MAIYYQQDVAVDDQGDLAVDDRGDIPLSEPKDSVEQAVKFMLATDYGEVPAEPLFGANIGSQIGETDMQEVLRQVPVLVREGFRRQAIVPQEDIHVRAIQVDVDQVYLTVVVHGEFFQDDGTVDPNPNIRLRFIFPFRDGELQALDG